MFIEAMRLSCHTPKFIKNGPYDAVLVHNYWPSAVKHPMVVDTEGELITRGGPDTLRGGMRNKFVTHAAALMYKHGETKRIVIAGAPIKGPGLPSGAQITKDALVRIHHIPEEAITIREDGWSELHYELKNSSKKVLNRERLKLTLPCKRFLIQHWLSILSGMPESKQKKLFLKRMI